MLLLVGLIDIIILAPMLRDTIVMELEGHYIILNGELIPKLTEYIFDASEGRYFRINVDMPNALSWLLSIQSV